VKCEPTGVIGANGGGHISDDLITVVGSDNGNSAAVERSFLRARDKRKLAQDDVVPELGRGSPQRKPRRSRGRGHDLDRRQRLGFGDAQAPTRLEACGSRPSGEAAIPEVTRRPFDGLRLIPGVDSSKTHAP
jgi:hypothetical protein